MKTRFDSFSFGTMLLTLRSLRNSPGACRATEQSQQAEMAAAALRPAGGDSPGRTRRVRARGLCAGPPRRHCAPRRGEQGDVVSLLRFQAGALPGPGAIGDARMAARRKRRRRVFPGYRGEAATAFPARELDGAAPARAAPDAAARSRRG